MRTLTLSRLQDTTNSTGSQDLTQVPVADATPGILSEETVARRDFVDVLAGSATEFPSVPVAAPNVAGTIQHIRGAKRELGGQIVAARQTQQENSVNVRTSYSLTSQSIPPSIWMIDHMTAGSRRSVQVYFPNSSATGTMITKMRQHANLAYATRFG